MVIEHDQTLALLAEIVRALDDKKAIDLRVLRVSAQSSITDYLVLATGTSEPHLRALRVELERVLDGRKARIAGMDAGEPGSGWTVVDAYQIMIHLFVREKRDDWKTCGKMLRTFRSQMFSIPICPCQLLSRSRWYLARSERCARLPSKNGPQR